MAPLLGICGQIYLMRLCKDPDSAEQVLIAFLIYAYLK